MRGCWAHSNHTSAAISGTDTALHQRHQVLSLLLYTEPVRGLCPCGDLNANALHKFCYISEAG